MMELDVTITQILALFVFIHIFFVYAIIKKRNDIADVAWGLGFVLLSLFGLILNYNLKTLIIFLLVAVWGFRLFFYISYKFRSKDKEDPRYAKWRAGWGKNWVIFSYLKVFLLQGFSLVLVAMPIILVSRYSSGNLSVVNSLGIMVWILGFVFEVIGDKQLFNFVKNKKPGEIMTKGLWKYSRHPNYFGEAVLWWGIWLISFGTPFFYFGLIGPLTINFLLRFVSGVPMAEERYQDNQSFIEYKKKTPPMIPNFFIR